GSLALGHETFVFATGDEELVARSKNLPVVDVATLYQRYPVSLIVPANSSIHTLADIKGHTIGEPGAFGATYVGLLAMLNAVHLSLSDVHVQSIGFTQVNALLAHRFDAVVGYSNNEPLELQKQGLAVRTFDVSDYQPLVSNGLITTEDTLYNQPQMVKAFVKATLQGMQEVMANPSEAIQISKSYIPGLNVDNETAVLQATIPIWQGSAQNPPGYNDSATWQAMTHFLVAMKLIPPVTDVSQAYTNAELP
ncbi:MAG TPA: ABC transporter substrate-binding protein, partial [Ktedonobacteraceae bacterium]|nr:ABC transporter substrate-binding protein [Ktedonobacteraceae bacterium]